MESKENPNYQRLEGTSNEDFWDENQIFFYPQLIGPGNFYQLKKSQQGPAFPEMGEIFGMSPLPHLLFLFQNSLRNKDDEFLLKKRLFGNTLIHYLPEGIYVEDQPSELNLSESVHQKKKNLENRLGSSELNEVVFSDDGLLRFVPYNAKNFKRGYQTPKEFLKNPVALALSKGEKNLENLTRVIEDRYSEINGNKIYLFARDEFREDRVNVAPTRIDSIGHYQFNLGEANPVSLERDEGYSCGLMTIYGTRLMKSFPLSTNLDLIKIIDGAED